MRNDTQKNGWYVIYTYPNNEKKIYNELCKRDITAFLPTKKTIRQWSDRKKWIEVPLFPNYVFVKVPVEATWEILMIDGVVKYVTFSGARAVVTEREIECVRRLLLGIDVSTSDFLNVTGEAVRVKQGPLAGMKGKVVCRRGATRFYVELESINHTISVEIDAALLAKADEAFQ